MADLASLRADVLDRLGLPTDDLMAQNGSLDRAINSALKEYAVELDWPWLWTETTITTVNGTRTSALPTRFARALYAYVGDEELEYRSMRDVIEYVGDLDQPRFYTGLSGSIAWVPTPDAAYSVVFGYVQTEPELVAAGDVPLIPDAYDDYIVAKAGRKIATRLRDLELMTALKAEEADWLHRMRGEARRTAALGRIKVFWRGV